MWATRSTLAGNDAVVLAWGMTVARAGAKANGRHRIATAANGSAMATTGKTPPRGPSQDRGARSDREQKAWPVLGPELITGHRDAGEPLDLATSAIVFDVD
jgi:hypothetical protein